jgi:hypothetical protein
VTSPSLAPALAQIGQQMARMQKHIDQLERNQRAAPGPMSIAAGQITFTDAAGVQQMVVGQQADGTHAVVSTTLQAPVQPDQPLAGPGILSAWVSWDGAMADGSSPLADSAGVQVHCSAVQGFTPGPTTLQGVMPGAGLFGIGQLTAGTTYYVCLVGVNQAGNTSAPSAEAQVTPQSVPGGIPAGSLSGLQLATGTVTAAQIAEAANILGSQIAQNTLTDANIQAGSITANSIASNTLTAAQIAAGIVVAGIVNGTLIEGSQFVCYSPSGMADGVYIYSSGSSPGPGNPPLIALGGAATDPYGNDTRPGDAASGSALIALGPSGSYTQLVASATTLAVYLGTGKAAEVSPGAFTSLASGTGGAQTLITQLKAPTYGGYAAELQLSSASEDGTTSAAYASLGVAGTGTGLQVGETVNGGPLLVWSDAAGTWGVDRTQTESTQYSTGDSTSVTAITKAWPIEADDGPAATVYELETRGQINTWEAGSSTLTFGLSLNGASPVSQETVGAAVFSAGVIVNWWMKWRVQVTATGSSGTVEMSGAGGVAIQGSNLLSSNQLTIVSPPVSAAFNTTVANTVNGTAQWGATATGLNLTSFGSTLTRKGP